MLRLILNASFASRRPHGAWAACAIFIAILTGCGDEDVYRIDRYCPDGLVALPGGGCARIAGDDDPPDTTPDQTDDADDLVADHDFVVEAADASDDAFDAIESEESNKDEDMADADGEVSGESEPEFHESSDVLTPDDEEAETEADNGELTILPRRDRVLLGERFFLRAWRRLSGASRSYEATAAVAWTSDDPSIIEADAGDPGGFIARTSGTTTLRAFYPGGDDDETLRITVYPRDRYEARGVWLNRWWIGSESLLKTRLQKIAANGFNQVYLQVRGRFDALYESNLEPWAAELGGLGKDPGWDPLAVAVAEGRRLGIEVHAWINVLSLWSGSTAPAHVTPEHVYHSHPEWIMTDADGTPMPLGGGEYIWVSPGIPAARQHIVNVAADLVSRYDIDGLHLDRIRYPGSNYSWDSVSRARYTAELTARPGLSYAQWEREQVTALVEELRQRTAELRPAMALSAATGGVYRNTYGWSAVTESYTDYLQDPAAWLAEGVIDVAIPMIYWQCRLDAYGSRTDFCFLVDDWGGKQADRFVYAGSDIEESAGVYIDAAQLDAQLLHVRSSNLPGHVWYDYSTMEAAGLWDEAAAHFQDPAATPFMPWKHPTEPDDDQR